MRSLQALGLAAALLLSTHASAETPEPQLRALTGSTASFSIVDRANGQHWWRSTNQDYRIETVQLEPRGPLSHYLFETTSVQETHIGIEGSYGHVRIIARPLDETFVGEPVWTIEAEGAAWELEGQHIKVVTYGCCGSSDTHLYFRVRDGRPIGE